MFGRRSGTHPPARGYALGHPVPHTALPKLIPHPIHHRPPKAPPPIIPASNNLQPLQQITLLHKRPQLPIQYILLRVQGPEQLGALLKRVERGPGGRGAAGLEVGDADEGARVEVGAAEVGPVADGGGGEARGEALV